MVLRHFALLGRRRLRWAYPPCRFSSAEAPDRGPALRSLIPSCGVPRQLLGAACGETPLDPREAKDGISRTAEGNREGARPKDDRECAAAVVRDGPDLANHRGGR